MDLRAFLEENNVIQSIEVVTFEGVPPQYVGLRASGGAALFVVNEMLDYGERTEIGSLKFVPGLEEANGSGLIELLPAGRVSSCSYLSSPDFGVLAGVRIGFDNKDLMITTGDAPYSLFVRLGAIERGRSEYPLDKYVYAK